MGFPPKTMNPSPNVSINNERNNNVPLEKQRKRKDYDTAPKLDSGSFHDEPIATPRKGKKTRSIVCSIISCLVLLALIGGGAAAAIILLKKDDKNEQIGPPVDAPSDITPSSIPAQATTVSPQSPITAPTVPPTSLSSIPPVASPTISTSAPDSNSAMKNLIVANTPDSGESLKDPTSPQSKALEWL